MIGDHSLNLPILSKRGHFGGVMKTKLLRLLSVLGLILAALASLDMTGYTAILPAAYAGKALAAGLFIAAIKDFIFVIGDLVDDGKKNNSWSPVVAWMLAPLCLLMLCPSCATSETTITAPDGTVTKTVTKAADASAINAGATAAANAALLLSNLRGGK